MLIKCGCGTVSVIVRCWTSWVQAELAALTHYWIVQGQPSQCGKPPDFGYSSRSQDISIKTLFRENHGDEFIHDVDQDWNCHGISCKLSQFIIWDPCLDLITRNPLQLQCLMGVHSPTVWRDPEAFPPWEGQCWTYLFAQGEVRQRSIDVQHPRLLK